MASFLTSLFGSSLVSEAVAAMAPVVGELFTKVTTAAPKVVSPQNSPAEVALGALMLAAAPALTSEMKGEIEHLAGIAVAQYETANPGVDITTDASQQAITALLMQGISKQGIAVASIPQYEIDFIVLGGILCAKAGIGTAALSVTA